MALKADVSNAALSIAVDGITAPVSADVQVVKLYDATAGSGSPTGVASNPLFTQLGVALPAGSNLIGSVGVASIPAADRTTDSISAALQTGVLMSGLVALTALKATISASSSGNTPVVAAVASKIIRVVSLFLVCNAAVAVKFQSATTDITGVMPFGANGGISLPFNPAGWFDTASGAALNINLGTAVAVGGAVTYVTV